ncbi:serine/threonine-protein kinase [Fischerella thermalis]|uniref:non-specific serine/threonine protein kinase n=1 Tax=Fischerella thermalis JSC-11 TaxID=741277 RepID=G6FR48_9CYAN|nr:serine/threonine-protein kinase [Fischerella thermalis]EHC15922.1 serine/threonine protein kinase [Fischerella thermalis JSC-11]PLZ20131.1 serine/threonine protein kinase [Fischerella thermalis WC1110]PLZ24025.1 serine/threonine protein kinase [Fischerella thermalis WC559]PLZ27549.1 serine/threonine protein kinase [Fischerella thermalis WC558]PLZ30555.1 serine/threonine protein kinase [Fischerella thermalis WC542]
MEIYCTRPGCPRPRNYFSDLDDHSILRTVQQKYCTACGMPLILVGRYLPTKLLGRGGFGAAFLACDRYTPGMRQCVVKQFQPAGNLSETQLKLAQDLFEREAIVLEEIGTQHEQIPDLFAYFPIIVSSFSQPGQQEQFFYLVQEYIDGQNLEEELNHKGQFSEQEVLDMLQDILKILQFVHNKGIIHRDIKPSNIMRHRNGKLYLLDFGAVKQVANTPPGGVGSSTGIFSLGFAPLEQMSGGQVFPSTDLYALAVTAVMLLTGEKDVTKLLDVYSNQWKWQERVSVSPLVANTLDRMLLPAANQRFQSAQEVLDALNLNVQPVIPTQIKSQPQPTPTQPAQQIPLSTLELLMGAGFSGFEGGLIAIALYSVLRSPNITFVACAVILAILIFGQKQRWIEKTEMLVLAAATWGVIFFFPVLRAGLSIKQVIILSVAAGLVAIAVTALFRLIYKLLTLFFSN